MTIDSLILLAGGLIAVLPFLGIPNRIDTILFTLLGVFVISLGIVIRRRKEKKPKRRSVRESQFVENTPLRSVAAETVWPQGTQEHDAHEVR
jgi:hypothetical protein